MNKTREFLDESRPKNAALLSVVRSESRRNTSTLSTHKNKKETDDDFNNFSTNPNIIIEKKNIISKFNLNSSKKIPEISLKIEKKVRKDYYGSIINKGAVKNQKITFIDIISNKNLADIIYIEGNKYVNNDELLMHVNAKCNCACTII